jgi:peroxiredoxin
MGFVWHYSSDMRLTAFLVLAGLAFAATKWTPSEEPLAAGISKLRSLSDDVRPAATRDLALQIRRLPASSPGKEALASGLASRATEGDPGKETLQEVTTTLSLALDEQPVANDFAALAQLAKYEHMTVNSKRPEYQEALKALAADDEARQSVQFTLKDLNGKAWSLKDLRGKVVLLNFWATWCPPCRKEMPDLAALYSQFTDQGLVILAVSDEEDAKVRPFIAEAKYKYPILLDPGDQVNKLFRIQGIPKTFIYDREGRIVAQSIDMRTKKQFLGMLAQAGIR